YVSEINEPLIARSRRVSEIVFVVKIHVDCSDVHDRAGNLCAKAQTDAFVRLNMKHQTIAREFFDGCLAKQHERRTLELNRNFGVACREMFPSAQIERH